MNTHQMNQRWWRDRAVRRDALTFFAYLCVAAGAALVVIGLVS